MVGQFILTCNGYNATISPAIQIYKGDSMKFEISVINKIITSIKGFEKVNYVPVSAASAKILVESPTGIDYVEAVITNDDKIQFKLPVEYTQEAGTYKIQIVLYDTDDDGSKCIIHLPHFTYEIKEPIGDVGVLSSMRRKPENEE